MVFFMLQVLGSGASCVILEVKCPVSLQAGLLRHFKTGPLGWSVLWSFMRPFMVGAEGLRLMSLHLWSCVMRAVLLFMVFLTGVW